MTPADSQVNPRPLIANVERLNGLLDRDGLAAVVARSGVNFTYLTGVDYPGTLARHLDLSDSPRGVFAVWPRRGEPVMVLNSIAAPRARRDTWLTAIHEYDGYGESPDAALARVLRDVGLDRDRVGFEKRFISAADWEELQRLLPHVEMVDCSATMDEVRWIKTPGEIALIRAAARMLDDVYLEVFPDVRPGASEREVHSRLIAACLRKGANWAHGILNSSRNTILYGGEGDFVFRGGDVIRNDYVLWLDGYPGHQSRSIVLGKPSRDDTDMYRRVRDIYRSTVAHSRPGTRASDVYRHAADAFKAAGFDGKVAIAGHSVGAWWHQQAPYLVPGCDIEIEAGMVLAFEPHVNHFHIQDMFLVTDDGHENLSPVFDTSEVFVAPAL